MSSDDDTIVINKSKTVQFDKLLMFPLHKCVHVLLITVVNVRQQESKLVHERRFLTATRTFGWIRFLIDSTFIKDVDR